MRRATITQDDKVTLPAQALVDYFQECGWTWDLDGDVGELVLFSELAFVTDVIQLVVAYQKLVEPIPKIEREEVHPNRILSHLAKRAEGARQIWVDLVRVEPAKLEVVKGGAT